MSLPVRVTVGTLVWQHCQKDSRHTKLASIVKVLLSITMLTAYGGHWQQQTAP